MSFVKPDGAGLTASGLNYANPTLNAEALNARRTADVNLIDLRFDRGFTLKGGRLSPFLDLYNLANSNAERNITVTSGTSWLRPINIIPPRVMRLGVKFDWSDLPPWVASGCDIDHSRSALRGLFSHWGTRSSPSVVLNLGDFN